MCAGSTSATTTEMPTTSTPAPITTVTTTRYTTAQTTMTTSMATDIMTTTSTTGNQFAAHPWFISKGTCTMDENGCASSPNHPGLYGNSESCTIGVDVGAIGPIAVLSFKTEESYDGLQVNGIFYSGNKGPNNVVPSGDITWSSDSTVKRKGWKICALSTTPTTTEMFATSTPAPTTTVTTTSSTSTTTTTTATTTSLTTM